jgi:hypothetical protein
VKPNFCAVLVGALIAVGSAHALAQGTSDWIAVKKAEELRAIYSNKTFRSKGWDGTPQEVYYRADGKALWVVGNRRIPRTWEVKGSDQVCHQDESIGRGCVRVERNAKNPKEFLINEVTGRWGGLVTVEDGVPQF